MDRKICPLTFAGSDIDLWCEREECEWWSGSEDECSVKALVRYFKYIAISLRLIASGCVDDGK